MGGDEDCSVMQTVREHIPRQRGYYDFTQSVRDDIEATFLNTCEFGAYHNLDGVKVKCAVQKSRFGRLTVDGIYQRDSVLYIDARSIRKPEPGIIVRLDGEKYLVVDADSLQGEMWKITLRRADT